MCTVHSVQVAKGIRSANDVNIGIPVVTEVDFLDLTLSPCQPEICVREAGLALCGSQALADMVCYYSSL